VPWLIVRLEGARMSRVVAALLVLVLVLAGALASAHDHAQHERSCAACVVAGARSTSAAPPVVLPRPLLTAAPLLRDTARGGDHARPPLLSAPKHGPPARG
jgi:hypothetical protein